MGILLYVSRWEPWKMQEECENIVGILKLWNEQVAIEARSDVYSNKCTDLVWVSLV